MYVCIYMSKCNTVRFILFLYTGMYPVYRAVIWIIRLNTIMTEHIGPVDRLVEFVTRTFNTQDP